MAVVLVVVVVGTEVVAVADKVVGLAAAQATVPGLAVDMVERMEAAAAVAAAEVVKVEALAMAPGLALDTVTAPAVALEMDTTDLTSMESSSIQEYIVKKSSRE